MADLDVRHLRRHRDEIVGHVAVAQLAGSIVDALLEQQAKGAGFTDPALPNGRQPLSGFCTGCELTLPVRVGVSTGRAGSRLARRLRAAGGARYEGDQESMPGRAEQG